MLGGWFVNILRDFRYSFGHDGGSGDVTTVKGQLGRIIVAILKDGLAMWWIMQGAIHVDHFAVDADDQHRQSEES